MIFLLFDSIWFVVWLCLAMCWVLLIFVCWWWCLIYFIVDSYMLVCVNSNGYIFLGCFTISLWLINLILLQWFDWFSFVYFKVVYLLDGWFSYGLLLVVFVVIFGFEFVVWCLLLRGSGSCDLIALDACLFCLLLLFCCLYFTVLVFTEWFDCLYFIMFLCLLVVYFCGWVGLVWVLVWCFKLCF